jgi:hypothetical protein
MKSQSLSAAEQKADDAEFNIVAKVEVPPLEFNEVLDWDYSLPELPPRASGRTLVRLRFAGCGKPLDCCQ